MKRPPIYALLEHAQFVGRIDRKNAVDKRTKSQRKLDRLDYEFDSIKANLEMEIGLAYREFLAGIVCEPMLLLNVAVGSSPTTGWYLPLLNDLGYSPNQLNFPKQRVLQ